MDIVITISRRRKITIKLAQRRNMANMSPSSDDDIAKYESCTEEYLNAPDPYYGKLWEWDRTEALLKRNQQQNPSAMQDNGRKPDVLSDRYSQDLGLDAPFHYRPLEQRFADYSSYLQQYQQLHQESVRSIGGRAGSAATTVNGLDSTTTTTTETSTALPSTLNQSVKVQKEEEAAASNEQVASSNLEAALISMLNDLLKDF